MPNSQVIDESIGRRLAAMIAPAAFALIVISQAHSSPAQPTQTTTFSSPVEAARALVQAVQKQDEATVQAILGVGREVTSTGDDSVDSLERDQFVRKYQEMHRLVREPDGTTVLYIGAENWPFPIPLTSSNGKWSFDARTGSQEILFRRIGENEATAVEICRMLAKPGAHDDVEAEPFQGYYFRAASGPGKARTVAFVAYPVKYRSSGVMTFIVTKDGAVYQKDLGPDTATLAPAMKQRPLSGWNAVN